MSSFEHCLIGSNNLGLSETLSQPSRYPDFYAYSVSLRHVVGRHIHEYRRRLSKGKKKINKGDEDAFCKKRVIFSLLFFV